MDHKNTESDFDSIIETIMVMDREEIQSIDVYQT